jgi:outer membrane biosynthesis protein TonB
MSTLQKFIRLGLPLTCTAALAWACASNTPSSKAPVAESASGSEQESSGTATASKDSADMPADNVDNKSEATSKPADESKPKADEGKKGAAPVDDSRTTASIQKIINDNRPKFKKCYEDERKKAQDLKGTIVLELTLDADGKIKKSGFNAEESTIKVKAVGDCVVKVAEGLTYPASSKGLDKDFRYEFGFNNH